ncbi:MAG: hypothetical protein JJU32_04970 [Phormidium sp. BM_Day4_Bin.17]|nr:hypothetical protein [Phormidium sp. BM_Day4_Bin.17]UCJ13505.1 MAG: hypothetical protein JWS08_07000 [Phormidium sp. PBR-2020]
MSIDEEGKLIQTAIKNIHVSKSLNPQEKAIAESLAKSISQTRRNWIPIYVKELETHSYDLIENQIILEASRLAGLKIVHCIQIDENPETKKQIKVFQDSLFLLSAENGKNHICKSEVSEDRKEKIFINREPEESLRRELRSIKGIGPKTINKILENRPFDSEENFLTRIDQASRFYENLKKRYEIEYA